MTTTADKAWHSLHTNEQAPVSLRLKPVARVKTLTDDMAPSSRILPVLKQPNSSSIKYPRLVVVDPAGRRLDTLTSLQEAIYRANWNRKQMREWPRTSLEWRLPKSPVPPRPDFSRAGPTSVTPQTLNLSHHHQHVKLTSQSHDVTDITRRIECPEMEIAVDDVAFVAESLNRLPSLPAFSFLRHAILAGQSTYIQIVASILLHQKQLRATDQREPNWQFPGFCRGCRRAGFCYGCSKNSRPHVHEDIVSMTGGGFRFWKSDRPRDPHRWKNPNNWPLPSTEKDLRDIIEKYGGLAAYEKAVMRAKREMMMTRNELEKDAETLYELDERRAKFQRLKNLNTYPPYLTIVSNELYGQEADDEEQNNNELLQEEGRKRISQEEVVHEEEEEEEEVGEINEEENSDDEAERRQKFTSLEEGVAEEEPSRHLDRQISEDSADRTVVRLDTGYFEEMTDSDISDEKVQTSVDNTGTDNLFQEPTRSRHLSRVRAISSHNERATGQQKVTRNSKANRFDYLDKERPIEEEEEARRRRERAKENVPFGKKRQEVAYTAPKFFTVQKSSRKITVAKDPFNSDRQLNLPKDSEFKLKKSKKKTTQFVEFKKTDRTWKAPKKFQVKHATGADDKLGEKLDNNLEGRKRGRLKHGEPEDEDFRKSRPQEDLSPDAGLNSFATTDVKSGLEEEEKEGDMRNVSGGSVVLQGQDTQEDKRKPKRRKNSAKTRAEEDFILLDQSPRESQQWPPVFKQRTPSPPTLSLAQPQSHAPDSQEAPLPVIDIPAVPDLPEIEEKLPEKRKQKPKFMVEPPPLPPPAAVLVKEELKRRKIAPKVRILPRHLSRHRRKSQPAEALVMSHDLKNIQDPLDFLAKWCIINPDRLPFYEMVFESTVADQEPRYSQPLVWQQERKKDEMTNEDEIEKRSKKGKKKKSGQGKEKKKKKEPDLKPNLLPIERGLNIEKTAMSLEEQHLEKLMYTLDSLQEKMIMLGLELHKLEAKRTKKLVMKARERFPEITRLDYVPKKKKGKKGKKKEARSMQPPQKLRPHEITDDIIVERVDEKMLQELCREEEIKMIEVEIEIIQDKLRAIKNRVEETAKEKLLADAFCMNHFFLRQGTQNNQPETFKRQQSELYNRLHPNPDYEMNLEEVEGALQQINNHLLTEKEFAFLNNILNLTGRERINFRLFSVIAALSEKVTQLDPVIRKLMNNFNYNALDIKMEKCKELFELLESENMPKGSAQAASLAVELTAGGMKPEHIHFVLNKFNRENIGSIDFLDFVTYVPLFVEIHKRIIQDPLKIHLDL